MEFKFSIEGLSREKAEKFLDFLRWLVDLMGFEMVGGFHNEQTDNRDL